MLTFMYDDCGEVLISEKESVFLHNLSKDCKTRTITKDGWKRVIPVKDLKVSPETYFRIGRYDHQFEGYDFYCYLCKHPGTTPSKCKCKSYFTVEENKENIYVARKNFILSVTEQYFKESFKKIQIQKLTLTKELIDKILFSKGKYGERILKLDYPPLFDYRSDYKATKKIQKHLEKIL